VRVRVKVKVRVRVRVRVRVCIVYRGHRKGVLCTDLFRSYISHVCSMTHKLLT
jgi:hypothetical protein